MKTNNILPSQFKLSVQKDEVFAIFDVDRVVINTTSWFHACIAPDLLIGAQDISEFRKLNDKTYALQPELSKAEFRKKTLQLIQKKINQNKNFDEAFLYKAGYRITAQLHIYNEPIQYLKYLKRLYGQNLRVLYISSGYQPFIQGVVDYIYKTKKITGIHYTVFGSSVSMKKNRLTESFFCSGEIKQRIAENLIAQGQKIIFAVEYDMENKQLLDIVSTSGGKTLFVKHISGENVNKSWKEFVKNNLSITNVKNDLINNNSIYSLRKGFDLQSAYPNVFEKFAHKINTIGIVSLNKESYQEGLENMLNRIHSSEDKKKLSEIFSQFVFAKKKKIFLRGKYYYHWVPAYIFADPRTSYEKWHKQLLLSKDALKIIDEHTLLRSWQEMTTEEKLLILCILDHYKNAVFNALNTIYAISIKTPESISDSLLNYLDTLAHQSTRLYYQLLFDVPDSGILNDLINGSSTISISSVMNKYQDTQQGMRELDDPYTIALSVLSLLEQMKQKKSQYDLIIDFSYGGLELGLAFLSISTILDKTKNPPHIIHCFYSSRKDKREYKMQRNKKNWFYDYIPKHYHKKLNEVIQNKQKILLYDNNVATFSTLTNVKEYFKKFHNIKTQAAVAAVFYTNASKYLLGRKDVEILNPSWQSTLDYQPMSDYITAFNTWGTSKKGTTIESIFFNKEKGTDFNPGLKFQLFDVPIFKICRIHNVYDLMLTVKNGGNMIGIHAVYPNRLAYLLSQKPFKPFTKRLISYPKQVPISVYESASIKAMQKFIPKELKQVLVLEKPTSVFLIKQSAEAYGLDLKKIYIQMQHRVSDKYIREVKQSVNKRVIATIGAFQTDFYEYFQSLQSILNEKTDFILLDLSNHQPDIISKVTNYKPVNKFVLLKKISAQIRKNKMPILLADDVEVSTMKKYLRILKEGKVNIAGIDMQNNVELPLNEQRYSLTKDKGDIYQMRIRKSANLLFQWQGFFNQKNIREKI